ncbi:MAG TPA: PQQ-binding-like beta-propeller repeat protein [Polyangiaceae bacterium]|jgi:outer membrane protein assembly factor BamB
MTKRLWIFAGAAVVATAAVAFAQRIDPRVATTLTIGRASGPAPTVRQDARRDGLSKDAFPRGPLKVAWRYATGGGQIEEPPVVASDAIVVVTTHGDVVWVPPDAGEGHPELARQSTPIAATSTSPPAMLADGTIVVVGGSGEAVAVGVTKTGLRFRTQLSGSAGGDELDAVAPLALDDGGVAVATSSEIALLDSSGNVRMRATLPESVSGPLMASGGRIFAVARSGVVYAWQPGGTGGLDVSRVGSFQQSPRTRVHGGAAMTSDTTLVAVVDDARLMTLDVRQGLAVPLATFQGGGFLGPVAYRRGVAYAMAAVPGHTFVIGIGSAGQEVMRVPVASSTVAMTDGGAPVYVTPPHVPVLVDDTGTIAFAAPEGALGVVDPAGIASTLDGVCMRPLRGGRGVTSLVSGGPGAIIATCVNGTVVRIVHGTADSP